MTAGPRYTDVSLTDAQSARWGGAMTTPMALACASRIAAAQPAAIEVCSLAVMQQCVARGEDPWQRVELLRQRCADTTLRASLSLLTEHGRHGADVISTEVATLWLHELAKRGVLEIVVIDPLMAIDRIAPLLKVARSLGLVAIAALPCTLEASDGRLRELAASLAAGGAARVMLRDEAGLMTTDRLSTLLPSLRAAIGPAVPLDLHLRCQTALGPMVAIEAARLGIDGLDTAFAPLANGGSVQALGTLLKSLRLLQLGTPASQQRLHAIAQADSLLAGIADRHGFGCGRAWVFDLAPYAHQLPGDVATQAMEQLDALGLSHRLHAFSNECATIRADLGSPPMLAPVARAIAEQALLHVQGTPVRYAEIRPGVRRALQQVYGPTPGSVDGALLGRVGALPRPRSSSHVALSANHPGASDAALVIAQACGIVPGRQPSPAAPDTLRYDESSPADALLAGLGARAASYAQLAVTGPGVSINLQRTEAVHA